MLRPLLVLVVLASPATSANVEHPALHRGPGGMLYGGPANVPAKAGVDTLLLMGAHDSGAPYVGNFEWSAKALDSEHPNVHGWTSIDFTQTTVSHWQISTYHAVNGLQSAWCGDIGIPSCDGGATDPDGGYGPNWNDLLVWRQVVANRAVNTTLGITATANIFSEGGYDRTTLQAEKFDQGLIDLAYWDGVWPGLSISETVTYLPGEYTGPGADEVVLIWRFWSDGGWDDADCSYPSSGAIQLDDVTITSDNGAGMALEDFEAGFGEFTVDYPPAVGDFAKIWSHLPDIDPCITNWTRQVAFIDDGIVVPGTGGTLCQDWCYGPGGYIVNTTGGLLGPEGRMNNAVISPVMAWADPLHSGARLTFGVYRHEDLSADAPGMFYTWHVRSTDTGDPADLDTAPWRNRYWVHYGGPEYHRQHEVVDDLLSAGSTHVQIRVSVFEIGWGWVGWDGNDGYPAPYFDNIRFETYPVTGPSLAAREIDLANDGFPENGTIDLADPGNLWVRFDMGQNISPLSHERRDYGDSLVFDCKISRMDAVMDGPPQMVYHVRTNPVFDSSRTDPTPYVGRADCGVVQPDRFFADLPDTGWLFPGDVVHYYLEATDRDTISGAMETSILPADTTGFSDFDAPMGYNPSFVMRALPTIQSLLGGQPPILFWNDFGDHGGRAEWHTAFRGLGLESGHSLDIYYTNGTTSGIGSGLGGKATAAQLEGYDVLLYSAGDLGIYTIGNGDDYIGTGPDVQVLTAWLNSGDRGAFLTGDNLAADLAQSGFDTSLFLSTMMNVTFDDTDIRDLIGGQSAPRVLVTGTNPVFASLSSWIAYGGCDAINEFDAVTAANLGTRIATFASASGVDGGYEYSACTLASGVGTAGSSAVISMPYDFMFIYTDVNEGAKAQASPAARTRILDAVIGYFGFGGPPPDPSDVPAEPPVLFSTRHHPNPFNPLVHINYTVARPGRLTVRVYDLRGRLVRSVLDEHVVSGAEVTWDGRDARGADAASGVYFYEARMHGEVQMGKMTLVR